MYRVQHKTTVTLQIELSSVLVIIEPVPPIYLDFYPDNMEILARIYHCGQLRMWIPKENAIVQIERLVQFWYETHLI